MGDLDRFPLKYATVVKINVEGLGYEEKYPLLCCWYFEVISTFIKWL